jgi:hypothetical protein
MSWLQRLLFGPDAVTPAPDEPRSSQLARVVAPRPDIVPFVQGPGAFSFDIVGESYYQDALAIIAGAKTEEGHEYFCRAQLRTEPDNPHDRNAVGVLIDGRKVGHLSRQDAEAYVAMLRNIGTPNQPYEVAAKIVGGWRRKRGEGHYGVKLDLHPF